MNKLEPIDPPCITEELRMLRTQVRRFVAEEVIPVADAWERDGCIPRAVFRRLGDLGLLGMRHDWAPDDDSSAESGEQTEAAR